MAKYVWGVDSSTNVTPSLLNCVKQNFGTPRFWGRYLSTVPNASEGLTKQEIAFLRENGIKILPIYNNFSSATGYRQGRVAANNAAFHAKKLGMPKGTVIFGNVEKFFDVDNEWIQGWVEAMYTSGYKTGLYHDPVNGEFNSAFCRAAKENEKVSIQTILWSAEPERGASSPTMAPSFKPKAPNCKSNVWIWQYGRDAKACPIDTNLADRRLLESLF